MGAPRRNDSLCAPLGVCRLAGTRTGVEYHPDDSLSSGGGEHDLQNTSCTPQWVSQQGPHGQARLACAMPRDRQRRGDERRR